MPAVKTLLARPVAVRFASFGASATSAGAGMASGAGCADAGDTSGAVAAGILAAAAALGAAAALAAGGDAFAWDSCGWLLQERAARASKSA